MLGNLLTSKTGGVFDTSLFNPTHQLKLGEEFITSLQMRKACQACIACPPLSVNAV